eukprot:TRINITY_DN50154_c0_g1_i2.p1 TRINITY_DN50154_c0_g1~~TRINITY_DN50154_c0_g1_i2.p1  ORF type:complete len:156 (+),score=22.59 TRINITY_DN50154_c0_g1_i2:95-562(+)
MCIRDRLSMTTPPRFYHLPFALVARWLCLPAVSVLLAIVNVGARRYPDANRAASVTDGGASDGNLRLPLSFLNNTLEQFVLHVACQCGLAASVPTKWLMLVPINAGLFGLGRILFYCGYRWLPVMRAYGFTFSIFPSFLCLCYVNLTLLGIDLLD